MGIGGKRGGSSRAHDELGVDLLSALFNLPTRNAIERAESERRQFVTVRDGSGKEIRYRILHEDGTDTDSSCSSSSGESSVSGQRSSLSELDPTSSPPGTWRRNQSRLSSWLHRHKSATATSWQKSLKHKKEPAKLRKNHRNYSNTAKERPTFDIGKRTTATVLPSATFPAYNSTNINSYERPIILPSVSPSGPSFHTPLYHHHVMPLPQFQYQPNLAQPSVQIPILQNPPPTSAPVSPTTIPVSEEGPKTSAQQNSEVQPPKQTGPIPTILAQELNRIQRDIDLKNGQLAAKSTDPGLEVDLQNLQQQLNATLDAAVAGKWDNGSKKKCCEPDPSTSTAPSNTSSTPENKGGPTPPSSRSTEGDTSPKLEGKTKTTRSAGPVLRHHCSECGTVRSARYHAKHSISLDKKTVPNYCRNCRKRRLDNTAPQVRHHYCFGCGRFRSKTYHRTNPAPNGSAPLPNYCRKCAHELLHSNDGLIKPASGSVCPAMLNITCNC